MIFGYESWSKREFFLLKLVTSIIFYTSRHTAICQSVTEIIRTMYVLTTFEISALRARLTADRGKSPALDGNFAYFKSKSTSYNVGYYSVSNIKCASTDVNHSGTCYYLSRDFPFEIAGL